MTTIIQPYGGFIFNLTYRLTFTYRAASCIDAVGDGRFRKRGLDGNHLDLYLRDRDL